MLVIISHFSQTQGEDDNDVEDDGQMEEVLVPQSTAVHAEMPKSTWRATGSPPPNPLDLLRKERENPNIFQEREDKRLKAEEEVRSNSK